MVDGRGNPVFGKLIKFHAIFMHIGQHIKEVMRQQGVTATQLAKDICCARTHVHRIFCKDSIDIALLERILFQKVCLRVAARKKGIGRCRPIPKVCNFRVRKL